MVVLFTAAPKPDLDHSLLFKFYPAGVGIQILVYNF
jgi:hypothetical protein